MNSTHPISASSTMCFVPLALNHFGMRGPHFESILKEFATIVVTRPEGCPLLQGPFALTHSEALHKIPRSWGSCITWTSQREHSSQIVRGMHAFYDFATFVVSWEGGGGQRGGG
jgi:hypothetical protein